MTNGVVDAGRFLLGLRLDASDPVTRTFLLFTSVLWLIAGVYGRTYMAEDPRRASFWSFFLLTLAGNVGVILAADVVGFYCFYALMTYAAYGIIAHERTDASRRAGRVYLVTALVGEMLLLTAFLLVVGPDVDLALRDVPGRVASSPVRGLLVALLLAGFGVKVGALFLHVWLPLAHPVAPTPASAVLSGAMIEAGLLGWLRFLPLGVTAMRDAGLVCLVGGFAAAFYGVAIGVTQTDPKTILAYSSVSQMGFMTAALGIGLASPEAAPAAIAAILLYAMHHALAKGALFLGAGVARTTGPSWFVALGLVWPALDIAGAPLSSGALVKTSMKVLVTQSPWGPGWLPALLSFGAVSSTLLMVVFLRRTLAGGGERSASRVGLLVPWLLLLLVDLGLTGRPADFDLLVEPEEAWDAAWPICVGVVMGAAAAWIGRTSGVRPAVPPGDVLVVLEAIDRVVRRGIGSASRALPRVRLRGARARLHRLAGGLGHAAGEVEVFLEEFKVIGLLFALLGAVLVTAVLLVAR